MPYLPKNKVKKSRAESYKEVMDKDVEHKLWMRQHYPKNAYLPQKLTVSAELKRNPYVAKLAGILKGNSDVYGLFFVGSEVVGLSTGKSSDLDIAVLVNPHKYAATARWIKDTLGWDILGEREDKVPYVLHKGDVDLLIVPNLKRIKADILLHAPKEAIPLREALQISPVSRTLYHRELLRDLHPQLKRELLEIKKEWKRAGLWREGISTIQLAVLLTDVSDVQLSGFSKGVEEFILNPNFKSWINSVKDPIDPKRKIWASVTNAPWLIDLFKVWAAHRKGIHNRQDLYKYFGEHKQIMRVKELPKDKRSRIIGLAKELARYASTQGYKMDIIDAGYEGNRLFLVYHLTPLIKKIKVGEIIKTEEGKKALQLYSLRHRLFTDPEARNPFDGKTMDLSKREYLYLTPKIPEDKMDMQIHEKFNNAIDNW